MTDGAAHTLVTLLKTITVISVLAVTFLMGVETERKRLNEKCLKTQSTPYTEAIAFCKELLK